jgi:DNA polymerase-3 subunit alpha
MKSEEQGGSSDTRNLRDAYKASEFYLKDAAQMVELFKRRPDVVARTLEIADKCQFEYPLAHSIIWPKYEIPAERMPEISEQLKRVPEHSEKQTLLVMRVKEGLRQLGLYDKSEYGKQAKMELDVIFDLGYEDYFLVQDMICDKVRDAGIAMGPGRGSGAGSVVLYALGVTKIDPIKNGLIFERFLNPGRGPQFDHRLNLPEFDEPKPKVPANMERDPSVRDQTLGRADW